MGELKCQVNKDELILCDNVQNTFLIVGFDNVRNLGVAYYDYGIAPNFQWSRDGTLLYLGVGKNLLCIDKYEKKVLADDNLQSVFCDLCYDSNKNYMCVVCELDVYCYCGEKQKWKIGFRDVVIDYGIIDDIKLSILCDDGMEYVFSLEDGKITE